MVSGWAVREGGKGEGTYNPPRRRIPPTKIFLVVGRLSFQTVSDHDVRRYSARGIPMT